MVNAKRLLGKFMCRIQQAHWYSGTEGGTYCVRCGWYEVDGGDH